MNEVVARKHAPSTFDYDSRVRLHPNELSGTEVQWGGSTWCGNGHAGTGDLPVQAE
jgi:hypothetical protein